MNWEVFNVFFKNANFNILMLSIATAGGIAYAIGKNDDTFFFIVLTCSLYCVFAFIFSVYKWGKEEYNRWQKQRKENKRYQQQKLAEEKQKEIDIFRMFDGLQKENKNILAWLILEGKKDDYSPNIRHFEYEMRQYSTARQAENISKIHRYRDGSGGIACIEVKQNGDSFYVDIDPILLKLINQDIKNRGLVLNNSNGDKQNQ